jgi:acyl-CoA synthetase (AMP-forming)/AMP-acid ligase II
MRSDVLFDHIAEFGSAPALYLESGETVDYARLAAAADDIGGRMDRSGLAFLLARNNAPSISGYVGMNRARVPMALLSASMNPSLLANLFAVYRPRYVYLPEDKCDIAPDGREIHRYGDYRLIETGWEPCPIHPDLALLTTTSGTTGSPKFVRQSRHNLAANTRSIVEYLCIAPVERAITTLPMNYVFGLSVVNSHLTSGAALILTDRALMEKAFWELLKGREATSLSGVPYTFQMLKQLRFARMNLPCLKTLCQAGGKLPVDLAREFAGVCAEKAIRFFIMYGAAEATARMSYLPPERSVEKPDSIGIAIPGGTFALIDQHDNTIDGPETVGELVYRGDNVTMGYATCREDLARSDERGGLLKTGDLARRDAEDFYYIVGRKCRFIKIFGNRVNLEDIEHYLRKAGIDNACAGRDDLLKIYVTAETERKAAAAAIQEMTGLHPSAFRVEIVERIPRNDAGKTLYSELPEV